MGRVYNIMDRLVNDRPVIQIDSEHSYPVYNSKNQVIFMKQLAEDTSIDDFKRLDMLIEAGLGKEALDYINSKDLSLAATNAIVNTIMAAVSDQDLEEIEKAAKEEMKKFRKK